MPERIFLPKQDHKAVRPDDRLTPEFYDALRRTVAGLQSQIDGLTEAQAQLLAVFQSLGSEGEIADLINAVDELAAKQDASPQLDAIANLAGVGIAVQQSGGQWVLRDLAGTSGRITVTNADGSAGDPTVDLATVGDSNTGTLQAITIDGFGRITGSRDAVLADHSDVDATAPSAGQLLGWDGDSWGPTSAGAVAWTTVKKTADETRSSTTTLTNDSQLSFSAVAGTRYQVRALVNYNQANATMDFKYTVAFSAAFSGEVARRISHVPASAPGTSNENQMIGTGVINHVGLPLLSAVAGMGYVELDLTFVATTSGTLSLQWAQNTSDAGSLTVLAGSYMEYMTC